MKYINVSFSRHRMKAMQFRKFRVLFCAMIGFLDTEKGKFYLLQ